MVKSRKYIKKVSFRKRVMTVALEIQLFRNVLKKIITQIYKKI